MNFWKKIQQQKKPFFCVAPMADVTDAAFRKLITKYSRHGESGGGPDVVWTEFVSANGLMSPGREALLYDLIFSEQERPIVAQLFSADPEKMKGAVRLCIERGFDGIDINMGCPDKTIEKQGAGARMIYTKDQAVEVIRAAQEAIQESGKDIPLSVKTRVGYNDVELDTWIPLLLQQNLAALTVHARTRKQLSKSPAEWRYLREIVALRDTLAPETVIIGNGDVTSLFDGKEKARSSGVDAVMVGRALFGNPWFFDESREMVSVLPKKQPVFIRKIPFLAKIFETKRKAPESRVHPITIEERLGVLVEHTILFEELLGNIKNFAVMKKHYKAYCTGFSGAKELRMKLMETQNAEEVKKIVESFLRQ